MLLPPVGDEGAAEGASDRSAGIHVGLRGVQEGALFLLLLLLLPCKLGRRPDACA